MMSNASRSPKAGGIQDIELKIKRLENYEKWGNLSAINFEQLVDKRVWDEYWKSCDGLHKEMEKCQEKANQIKAEIEKKIKR